MKKICIVMAFLGILAMALFTPAKSNNKLPALSLVPPVSDSAGAFLRGKNLYKTYCLSCHQFDGGGVENLNPPLIKTSYVLGSKAGIIQIVLKGFDKREEIDGEDFSNNMPSLNYLTDQQIADVLTYVRNDFGNKASAISNLEVRQVRGRLTK